MKFPLTVEGIKGGSRSFWVHSVPRIGEALWVNKEAYIISSVFHEHLSNDALQDELVIRIFVNKA
jgi:hypothetical protein